MKGRLPHLGAGALQALRDAEGPRWQRTHHRVHLWLCRACRVRLEHQGDEVRRLNQLLAVDTLQPNLRDAWQRFLTITSEHPRRPTPRHLTRRLAALAACIAAILTMAPGVVGYWSTTPDLTRRLYDLSAESALLPKGPSDRDKAFGRSLARLEAEGRLQRISDQCCEDRDGEGPADDGVLTVSLPGGRSTVVILYEDTRRSGRFEPGDVVLMVSRPGLSADASLPRWLDPATLGKASFETSTDQ